MRRIKAIGRRLALSGASLAVVFVLFEVALRVVYAVDRRKGGTLEERLERSRNSALGDGKGRFSIDGLVQSSRFPGIVYELKPGVRGLFREVPVSVNSHGLRDVEYPLAKPAGTVRIVGLGDSIMFGWGVREEDCFLSVLERALNNLPGRSNAYEVLNFAVPGYNTAIEVAVLEEKALAFDPDIVIIQFVSNDYGVPMLMQKDPDYRSLRHSYAWDFVQSRLGWIYSDAEFQARDPNLTTHNRLREWDAPQRDSVMSRYRDMVGSDGFRRSMRTLGRLAQARGIRVIVLSGKFFSGQKKDVRDACRESGFTHVNAGPYTDAYMQRHGIPEEDSRRTLWVAAGDSHPNAVGHAIYAEALMNTLQRMGLVTNIPPVLAPAPNR